MIHEISMFSLRQSDAAIVQRTLEGRPQAFEALVFRYQTKAHAVARALGLKPPEADDAIQEAFLQAFRDLPSLREPASFGGWFLNIVRHVSIKELRRASRGGAEAQGTAPPPAASAGGRPGPSAADQVEQKDFREHVWRKVAALPQGMREAIFLYYYQGESVRAVARVLGLSIPGVKKRLRSAREELREKLWHSLEEQLRKSIPNARQWRTQGRRLSVLILASIPTGLTARAGAITSSRTTNAIEVLSRRAAVTLRTMKRPVVFTAAKKASLVLTVALLLLFLGRGGWFAWGPGHNPPAAALRVPATRSVQAAAGQTTEVESPQPAVDLVAPSKEESQPAAAAQLAVEDDSDSANRGSVVIRLIWADDRTPAAGVRGHVTPWASPDLYIDERMFISGPDGTARADHIWKGGASVWLDRGGNETKVKVEPGEESELVLEVPPGFNVQGVVVDRNGFTVAGARVWISQGGFTNLGYEVATTSPDGSFFVRAISNSRYIAARARGHATSHLRPMKAEPGTTLDVRLVLNGAGGELWGTVQDESGLPVRHAKVMVGTEYSTDATLGDGSSGLTPPPFVEFTDDEGSFHADSLAPGKTRVAVRAPGFVPLEEEVEVERGGESAVELILRRGATLSGHVTGPGGVPLGGAHVVIGDYRDMLAIKVFSGAGGAYQLRGLPPGDLEVFSQRRGVGKASKKLSVKGNESLRWDPVLVQDLEIRGRLLDGNLVPLEGFVIISDVALGQGLRWATQTNLQTDEAGRFTLSELSDLSYRLTVYEPKCRFACAVLEEIRPDGEELEVRIDRQSFASAYLVGNILDPHGNPFPEAKVTCSSSLGGSRWYLTAKETGAFRLGPLPRGRYWVEVQAAGYPVLQLGEQDVKTGEERDLGVHYLRPPSR